MTLRKDAWGYLIIWEYRVGGGMESRFEQIYGSDGDWAQFFRRDPAYLGTELIRDAKADRSYVTLDLWASHAAYEEFRQRHGAEYEAIDQKCGEMTEQEREVGRFVRVEG